MTDARRVCVFCGSSRGVNDGYAQTAKDMGRALVRRGLGLVYGGGSVGLMGILADAVLAEGAEVVGVIPEDLLAREVGKLDVTDLHVAFIRSRWGSSTRPAITSLFLVCSITQ